ncbi:MAG: hypothetical protein FWD61_12090 [Phycisphaerales bacterium]|nr:hypothetical protein [Phycisphaerales bacterium]
MSSIGTISFDIMRGLPALLKSRVDTWEVPGVDGYGAQLLGKGDAEFDLVTISYLGVGNSPNNEAQFHILNCAAMQGTIQTIVDDWGDSYANILIHHYEAIKQPCIKDGVQQVRVEGHWHCITASGDTSEPDEPDGE